jgi:hypothetical protein
MVTDFRESDENLRSFRVTLTEVCESVQIIKPLLGIPRGGFIILEFSQTRLELYGYDSAAATATAATAVD